MTQLVVGCVLMMAAQAIEVAKERKMVDSILWLILSKIMEYTSVMAIMNWLKEFVFK